MADLIVVFVVGKGRSGSTLLDDLLGTMPRVVSVGELSRLWGRGRDGILTWLSFCACGRPVAECDVWGPVLSAAIGGTDRPHLAAVEELQERALRWRRVPALMLGARPAPDRRFGDVLGRVYRGLADATGARIVVDSSKWPAHPGLLGMVPGVVPFLLHLVRDPRAVAHSYRRRQPRTAGLRRRDHGAVEAALSWDARNAAVELFARTLPASRRRRIRYEDLAAAPREVIRELGEWLGLPDGDRAFIDDTTVHLGTAHLVGGSRHRFERGDVAIRPDLTWQQLARTNDHRIVSALTKPLRWRYGYG